MTFATQLDLTDDCSGRRLTALVRALQRRECLVRIDPFPNAGSSGTLRIRGRDVAIDVQLPADAYSWIVTGGFHGLLAEFEDVVRAFAPFTERHDHSRLAPPLPRA